MSKKPEWNVFHHNINSNKIEKYNVFDHGGFMQYVEKLPHNKDAFIEGLKKEVQYYFWCKCEAEVVITSWPAYIDAREYQKITEENNKSIEERGSPARVLNVGTTAGRKIDIYEQLMLNWDAFAEYTWKTMHPRLAKRDE